MRSHSVKYWLLVISPSGLPKSSGLKTRTALATPGKLKALAY